MSLRISLASFNANLASNTGFNTSQWRPSSTQLIIRQSSAIKLTSSSSPRSKNFSLYYPSQRRQRAKRYLIPLLQPAIYVLSNNYQKYSDVQKPGIVCKRPLLKSERSQTVPGPRDASRA